MLGRSEMPRLNAPRAVPSPNELNPKPAMAERVSHRKPLGHGTRTSLGDNANEISQAERYADETADLTHAVGLPFDKQKAGARAIVENDAYRCSGDILNSFRGKSGHSPP